MTQKPLVLVVDDCSDTRDIRQGWLEEKGYPFETTVIAVAPEIFRRLHPQVVVIHYVHTEETGLELIEEMYTLVPETLFVLMSGANDLLQREIRRSLCRNPSSIFADDSLLKKAILRQLDKDGLFEAIERFW
ncbi:MAG: hypothetical protein ACR2RB_04740 [Gammaproteobacteria bacterium]